MPSEREQLDVLFHAILCNELTMTAMKVSTLLLVTNSRRNHSSGYDES